MLAMLETRACIAALSCDAAYYHEKLHAMQARTMVQSFANFPDTEEPQVCCFVTAGRLAQRRVFDFVYNVEHVASLHKCPPSNLANPVR
jgi:hypothetical protein